jgi:N-acyl-D-aspartate/D-glutamate deacylase
VAEFSSLDANARGGQTMTGTILIKGGTIVDGTGTPGVVADVLLSDGKIAEVGQIDAHANEIVDAIGLLVTPGFVDIHTHYDGQVYWDPLLTPSSWHGATTVIMGNCSVGFAPARPDKREELIELMHYIEDIPAETLRAGIPWGWETFEQYLDALDRIPRAIDVGTLVPHGAVRTYVMGERGRSGVATAAELEAITRIIGDAIDAGALGCSGNRGTHGGIVPGSFAPDDELIAIAEAVGSRGAIFETNPNSSANTREQIETEVALLRRMSLAANLTITLPLTQYHHDPDGWRKLLAMIEAANADGARLIPQILSRPLNIVMGLGGRHPFSKLPSYNELTEGTNTTAELAARLARPDVRQRLLEEARVDIASRETLFDVLYAMTDPPIYEPLPETSIGAVARSRGLSPAEVFYEAMLEDDGNATFLATMANYAEGNSDAVFEMIQHPATILGLSDGGAHALSLCDASSPTTVLAYWVRDRVRGPRLPIEIAIRELAAHPAQAFGLHDRGVIVPGMRADINLIDLGALRMGTPEFLDDLPANGRRMVQRASGYVATYVAGEKILENGRDTGARPGRTIRRPMASANYPEAMA